MEDAATAEISRAQVWQWIRHEGGVLEDGRLCSPPPAPPRRRKITTSLVRGILHEESTNISEAIGGDRFAAGKFHLAQASAPAVGKLPGRASRPRFTASTERILDATTALARIASA